jgi:predicted outer membrane protein
VSASLFQFAEGMNAQPKYGEIQMLKSILAASALLICASTASFAAEEKMACDDASIMKMEEAAMAMKDPAMKESMEMAMKEVEMAKMAMKESKTDDCSMHLGEAMKATMKK